MITTAVLMVLAAAGALMIRERLARPGGGCDRAFILTYPFPAGMIDRALEHVLRLDPTLESRLPAHGGRTRLRVELEAGLRQFLLAAGRAPEFQVRMPSRAVDEAWHEFITHTEAYAEFCRSAFGGRFLHHTPDSSLEGEVSAATSAARRSAMRATWTEALAAHPLTAAGIGVAGVPLLFSLDAELGIADRVWEPTCGDASCTAPEGVICAEHTLAMNASGSSSSGSCGGGVSTSSASDSSCGGGCGGGCGGCG